MSDELGRPGEKRQSAGRRSERTTGRSAFRCVCVALLCSLAGVPAAHGAEVTVLGADGRARVVEDPFVPAATDPPVRSAPRERRARGAVARAAARRPTVRGELRRLEREGLIDPATQDERRAAYDDARRTLRKLEGARRVELRGALKAVEDIAGRRQLTASRLPALWLMMSRNVRWWTTGPLLAGGRRVSFSGSELVWQHYPGSGLQLQVLATFGKLNGLWQGKTFDDRLERLLDELLALPAERAGGLAWEYNFPFARGRGPWVSGMAQATGVQALARAATRLGREAEVLPVAQRALTIFEQPPPAGVALPRSDGAHYLLYSFDSDLRVLNGFAQAAIGLHDFAELAGDPRARALFEAGDRVLRREAPAYDTGAWSLYALGRISREADLNYHRLNREFLSGLCRRTGAPEYCDTRTRFARYERERPVVGLPPSRLRAEQTGRMRFELSKISRVGIQATRGGQVVFSRGPFVLGRGRRWVEWRPLRAGRHAVRVTAVDLAGNTSTASGTVTVTRAKKPKRP